jgi:hypothetical protein
MKIVFILLFFLFLIFSRQKQKKGVALFGHAFGFAGLFSCCCLESKYG